MLLLGWDLSGSSLGSCAAVTSVGHCTAWQGPQAAVTNLEDSYLIHLPNGGFLSTCSGGAAACARPQAQGREEV